MEVDDVDDEDKHEDGSYKDEWNDEYYQWDINYVPWYQQGKGKGKDKGKGKGKG